MLKINKITAIKLSIYEITSLSLFLSFMVASQLIDQYFIVVVQPLHLLVCCLVFSIIGLFRSLLLINLYGVIFWLMGNFSFIINWQQFVILWFVGYLLCLFSFYRKIQINKKKINILLYLLLWITIWFSFIVIVIIANGYYGINSSHDFITAIGIGFLSVKSWLTQVIAAIICLFLLPALFKFLHPFYLKERIYFTKKYKY